MRIPDPKANTTTEAYLAYKAGYLEESELKPSLYEPYLHFDAWLAYWAGLTNTYPTDENGNPEILTDEEALVAYLSSVTNTYPEEIKDPYDVRIVGYLKYLVSARWGRPEYPVNNEEFYLSTMKPPVVPSGDTPSSDIELDDTAEAPFIDLKMYGDTFQQTSPAPNPDYPQNINVVTGKQTVTVSDGVTSQDYVIGLDVSNMIDINNFQTGGMDSGVPNLIKWQINCGNNPIKVSPNTQYTISVNLGETVKGMRVGVHSCDANLTFINDSGWKQLVPTPYTFTTGANVEYVKLIFSLSTTSSTVTSGGTQDTTSYGSVIEWFRGATVKMNEGSSVIPDIELCKIGTYQDYIYKSGDDWYVYKELASITFNGSETGWDNDSSSGYFRTLHDLPGVANAGPNRVIVGTISNYFTPSTQNAYGVCFRNNTNIYFYPQNSITTLADFKTWLGTHNTLVYHPLATPTNTKITDNTLIGQLDALMEGGSYEGKTYIKVTATDPNLPGLLYVEAGKYD